MHNNENELYGNKCITEFSFNHEEDNFPFYNVMKTDVLNFDSSSVTATDLAQLPVDDVVNNETNLEGKSVDRNIIN